jgi:hypothetical protein
MSLLVLKFASPCTSDCVDDGYNCSYCMGHRRRLQEVIWNGYESPAVVQKTISDQRYVGGPGEMFWEACFLVPALSASVMVGGVVRFWLFLVFDEDLKECYGGFCGITSVPSDSCAFPTEPMYLTRNGPHTTEIKTIQPPSLCASFPNCRTEEINCLRLPRALCDIVGSYDTCEVCNEQGVMRRYFARVGMELNKPFHGVVYEASLASYGISKLDFIAASYVDGANMFFNDENPSAYESKRSKYGLPWCNQS